MKLAALMFAALPISAALVDPFSQPDYLPQLQEPYSLPVSFASLQMGFPQNDFSGSNGLTCYFGITNPARPQAICTTPAIDSGFVLYPPPANPVLIPPGPMPVQPSPIPEPGNWCLAGFGLLMLSGLGWRRKSCR
jgi:hypothetical protein